MYDLNKTSEDSNFERKIKASDLSTWFGYSVALHGTTLVVGAPNDDDNGDSSGSVYVYDLTLDGNAETTGNPATPYVDGFETKITAS
ncbi:MAG: FG-GAP repeat protein, partial [Acholeplasmataceae bacterium]